jgi:hypothetical protein
MEEGLSRAVLKVFVDLQREGLVYKDKRLVNWGSGADVRCASRLPPWAAQGRDIKLAPSRVDRGDPLGACRDERAAGPGRCR